MSDRATQDAVLKEAESISDPVIRAAYLIQRGPPSVALMYAQTSSHPGTQYFIARIRDEDYVRRALLDNPNVCKSVVQRLTRDSSSVTRGLAEKRLSQMMMMQSTSDSVTVEEEPTPVVQLEGEKGEKKKRRSPSSSAGRYPTADRVKCEALYSLILEMRQKSATIKKISEVLGVKLSAVTATVFSKKRLIVRSMKKVIS